MVSMPSRCSFSSATGPMPHSRRTGSPSSNTRSSSRRTTRMPSGLARPEAILAICLPEPGADRCHQAGLVPDPGPQLLAEQFDVFGCGAGQFGGLAERLVERQLLEHGHHAAHGVEHPAAGHAVDHATRRQHHRRYADQPPRLVHRHRRAGTMGAGFVAGAGDDTPAAETTDQNRSSAQGGPGQLLDGGEERIHVEVQDPPGLHDCRCVLRAGAIICMRPRNADANSGCSSN